MGKLGQDGCVFVLAEPCLESVPPDPLHRAYLHNGGRPFLGDELLGSVPGGGGILR